MEPIQPSRTGSISGLQAAIDEPSSGIVTAAHSETAALLPTQSTPLVKTPSLQRKSAQPSDEETPLLPSNATPAWSLLANAQLPWHQRPSIFWILAPFLLVTLCFGGIIVPKINLILALLCDGYLTDRALDDPSFQYMPVVIGAENAQCQIPEVQARVSRFMLLCNVAAGLLAACIAPLVGSWSDRVGRVRALAFTSLGPICSEVITVVVAFWPQSFSVYWILFAFVCEGATGSFMASMAVTYAYASDTSTPAKRGVNFAIVQSCLFGGLALGPLLAGSAVKVTGDILAMFYIAVAANVIYATFLLCFVPEPLTKDRQLAAREKWAADRAQKAHDASVRRASRNALGAPSGFVARIRQVGSDIKRSHLFVALRILWPTGPGSSPALRRNLVLLAAIDTMIFCVAMGSFTVIILYSEYRFHWGNFGPQMLLATSNITRVTVLLLLFPLIVRLFRRRTPSSHASAASGSDKLDLGVLRASLLFDMAGYIGYGLAPSGAWLFPSAVVAAFGGMASPTLSSSLTKHVPPDRVGQLMGATALLHALARVGGPALFNGVYYLTVGTFPQAVFLVIGALFFVTVVCSWFVQPHVFLDESSLGDASNEGSSPVGA